MMYRTGATKGHVRTTDFVTIYSWLTASKEMGIGTPPALFSGSVPAISGTMTEGWSAIDAKLIANSKAWAK